MLFLLKLIDVFLIFKQLNVKCLYFVFDLKKRDNFFFELKKAKNDSWKS